MAKTIRKITKKKLRAGISVKRVRDPQTGKMIVIRTIKTKKMSGNGISETRARDPRTGEIIVVRTIKMNPETFGASFTTVFQKNVDRARRENRALTGTVDATK